MTNDQPPVSALSTPIRIKFDEERQQLLTPEGKPYTGRRFSSVRASSPACSTLDNAYHSALEKVIAEAQKRGADAFEVTGIHHDDTRQEYDSTPYTATATAILYKRE